MSINRSEYIDSIYNVVKDKNLAIEIEKSIYEYSLLYITTKKVNSLFRYIYEHKLNDILQCIIKKTFSLKSIDISKIAYLNPQELNYEKYRSAILKLEKEKESELPTKGSTAFKCSKCGARNSSVQQLQTRAGDEAPSSIITCLECGFTFKIA